MNAEAGGLFGTVLSHIDWVEVVTTLLISAVLSTAGYLTRRLLRTEKKISWTVLYDERINIGTRAVPALSSGPTTGDQMWDIVYKPRPGEASIDVEAGTLAVVEFRNIGRSLTEQDFSKDANGERTFRLVFPRRRVVHWKIRDNDEVRSTDQIRDKPAPKSVNYVSLPAFDSNHDDAFKVVVLLTQMRPGETEQVGDDRPEADRVFISGHVHDGRFEQHEQRSGRPHRPWRIVGAVAGALLLFAAGGWSYGVWLTGRTLTPAPQCAGGTLQLDGSTAFAPIAKQVATEYEQDCQGEQPQITVDAMGSVAGLQALSGAGSGQVIAMYDGLPSPPPDARYQPHAVGWIIFAVVGNRASLPAADFLSGNGNGLTTGQIAAAFNDPNQTSAPYAPVGRSSASGTRAAFVDLMLGGDDSAERDAATCPSPAGTGPTAVSGTVCLESSTMQLLDAVNTTPDAIGYAEDDALPFFPGVGAITVDGYEPSRADALDQDYRFGATEHLYTDAVPAAGSLTADFLDFLGSPAVVAQLRDTSFISCADLAGSRLSGACDQ